MVIAMFAGLKSALWACWLLKPCWTAQKVKAFKLSSKTVVACARRSTKAKSPWGEVLTVLPFQNTLATFELKGKDVIAALENGVSQVEDGAGRFPQVAGMKYTWDPEAEAGSRIVSVEVMQDDGSYAPLDPEATYGVATNNYMRGGGDGYKVFETEGMNAYDYGPGLEVVVADYIAKLGGDYQPMTDDRIQKAE